MKPHAKLHRLLDLAIESHKELHPELVEQLDPGDYDTMVEFAFAARSRDLAVARPVIVRSLAAMLKPGSSFSLPIRTAAAEYLGENWRCFDDSYGIVRALTHGLFDSEIAVQISSANALGRIRDVDVAALKALEFIENNSDVLAVSTAARSARERIQSRQP